MSGFRCADHARGASFTHTHIQADGGVMAHISGGCLCGRVRVQVLGEPLRVGLCHCLHCRKHHGALFYAAAIFPRRAASVTGETRDYHGRHFCPNCGSSVFAITGDEFELHLGALDQPGRFTPGYECWTLRREPWLPSFPGIESHPTDRDGPDQIG